MNFSMALQLLVSGGLSARQAWGPTSSATPIALQNGAINQINYSSGALIGPYTLSQADILATYWYQLC